MAIEYLVKDINIKNLDGQEFIDKYGFKCSLGVKGRNSHNKLYIENVGWESKCYFRRACCFFEWISEQVNLK